MVLGAQDIWMNQRPFCLQGALGVGRGTVSEGMWCKHNALRAWKGEIHSDRKLDKKVSQRK